MHMKIQEGLEILEPILPRTKFYMMHVPPTVLDLQTVNAAPLNLMEISNLTLVAPNGGVVRRAFLLTVQKLLKAVSNTFTAILWKESTRF